MRITIDARLKYYRPGGIAEYTQNLVRALAEIDHKNVYFILHHVRDRQTLAPAPNFRRVNTLTPSHHRLEQWSLAVELLRLRTDVYHTPEGIPPQRSARHDVITIHDVHYLHYPQYMTVHSRRYYNDQIGRAVRQAAHILVPSHATARDLTALLGVPPAKMTVQPLGVDVAFRPIAPADVAAVRERYGVPADYLLFVGTFEPRKNIPGLLNAYARLRAAHPQTPPLVLAGRRGWLADDIDAAVERLKLARHLIWVEGAPLEHLPALYSGARLLALPSHYEGFGLTALEAMACGTPPVVADRASLPEVVGDAGLLIDPDDPDSLARAMQSLIEDDALHQMLRARGLQRAAEFTWARTAAATLDVYRAVNAV